MNRHTSILVVAQPSRTVTSLLALLHTLPDVASIEQVQDMRRALQMILHYRPDLMLLASDLPHGEAWLILDRLKRGPLPRKLVLANTIAHKKRAELLGAHDVLLRGFGSTELFESIQKLLAKTNEGVKR